MSEIAKSPYFSMMMDETTDIANKEQVVICIRWLQEDLSVHDSCLGLFNTPATDSSTLFLILKDVLLRFGLSTTKLRQAILDNFYRSTLK